MKMQSGQPLQAPAPTALNWPDSTRARLYWTPNFSYGCGCCGNAKTEEP